MIYCPAFSLIKFFSSHNRPVNLLRITPHRIINAVAFASMSSTILSNFFSPTSFGTVQNEYGQVFIDRMSITFLILGSYMNMYFRAFKMVLGAIPNSSVHSPVWLLTCIHSLVGNDDGSCLLYLVVSAMHSAL